MPLWIWRRSCCGGAAGDDDCSVGNDYGHGYQGAIAVAAVTRQVPLHETLNCYEQVDENNVSSLSPMSSNDMDKSKDEKLLFCPQNYQMLTAIGDGGFSGVKIWLSRHVALKQYVAIKRIDLDQCPLPFSLIQHEITMHRLLRHKNILPIINCFTCQNEIWMVLPLKAYGSCRDLLRAHFKFGLPEMAIAYILKDVLQALDYLHTRGIIHRDIRASHIFVQSDGSVCLSGLRHCLSMISRGHRVRYVHDFPDFYVNSLNWASRELLEQNLAGYDTKSDVYSLGITACELANGMVPFQDMPITQMLLSKIEGTTPRLLDITTIPELGNIDDSNDAAIHESLLPYRRSFSEYFHNFIELCLLVDPQSRPSAVGLSSHNFFKQILRKSNPPQSLTELLKPLNPITASNIPALGDNVVDSLAHGLADVTLDVDWSF